MFCFPFNIFLKGRKTNVFCFLNTTGMGVLSPIHCCCCFLISVYLFIFKEPNTHTAKYTAVQVVFLK